MGIKPHDKLDNRREWVGTAPCLDRQFTASLPFLIGHGIELNQIGPFFCRYLWHNRLAVISICSRQFCWHLISNFFGTLAKCFLSLIMRFNLLIDFINLALQPVFAQVQLSSVPDQIGVCNSLHGAITGCDMGLLGQVYVVLHGISSC